MLQFVSSDLFQVPADFIVHQVNCRGVMGAGLALAIRNRVPAVYTLYKQYCSTYNPSDLLGKSFIKSGVISVFGQLDYGRDTNRVYTDYNALKQAFTSIHNRLPLEKSIAFPFGFGCGLANGNWYTVRQLIELCFPGRVVYIARPKKNSN